MTVKTILLSVAATAVFFVVYSTLDQVPTSKLSKKLGDSILPVLCGKGSSSPVSSDPLITDVLPLVASNVYAVAGIAFVSMLVSSSFKLNKGLTIILRSVAFTGLLYSTLAFFRYEKTAEVKAACITTGSNANDILQRNNDMLAPIFQPLSYLPPLLLGVSQTHPAQEVYLYGIYPHLAEYFITLEPYLPIFYSLIAILLLVRPAQIIFWDNLVIFSALSGLLILGLSFTNVGNPYDGADAVSVLALRAVIFVLVTFALFGIITIVSRVVAQRLSLLSLLFAFMRLHWLGFPSLGLHVEIPLVITLLVTVTATCDTSNGAVLLWAVLGYVFKLPALEYALLVRLVDNLVLHLARKQYAEEKRSAKVKGD